EGAAPQRKHDRGGRAEQSEGEQRRRTAVREDARVDEQNERVGRRGEAQDSREAEPPVGKSRKERVRQGSGERTREREDAVPEKRRTEGAGGPAFPARRNGRLARFLAAGARNEGRGDTPARAREALPIVQSRRDGGHRGGKDRTHSRRRKLPVLPEEENAGMVVNGEGLLGPVVGNLERPERRIGRDVRRAVVPEPIFK